MSQFPVRAGILPFALFFLFACSPREKNPVDQKPWTTPSLATYLGPRILLRVRVGEKWGYAKRTGEVVVPGQFDKAMEFQEGRAAVCVGKCETVKKEKGLYGVDSDYLFEGKWGFIDQSGKYAVNPQFDNVTGFKEGLARVCLGIGCGSWSMNDAKLEEKWGFIDQIGKLVINPHYEKAYDFFEGLAAVCETGCGEKDSARWGYINTSGTFVITPQFATAGQFWDGIAEVSVGKDKDRRVGYIDRAGKYLINPM